MVYATYCMDSPPVKDLRHADPDLAPNRAGPRICGALSELRTRPFVSPLSQGRKRLRSLRRGFHAAARRRLSGLSCDRGGRPHRGAVAARGRGGLCAAGLAAASDLATGDVVQFVGVAAADQGRDRCLAMADRHAWLRGVAATRFEQRGQDVRESVARFPAYWPWDVSTASQPREMRLRCCFRQASTAMSPCS